MALALSWTGYADTDIDFADFAATDHTIVVRFMPQFPVCGHRSTVVWRGARRHCCVG